MCVWQWCSEEITKYISDNLPYAYCEQIGKEIRDISDEIPFEIPDSWEWVRFSNLVNFSMGKTPPRKETEYWENPIYPWVSIADMPADGTVLSTKEKVNQYAADNTFKSGISPIGTLIMSFKLTVGKVSILGIDAYHNEAIISIFPFVDDDRIVTSYLFKVLPLIAQNGDTKTAIKGATLNSDSLSNLLIPLPPLTEQKRIVNRIVELEPYVSAYDIAETHLTALNTTFPEALKKSILQEAVQGKLVPQNPDDEPASVLLERIRAEKQALIKAGKIKKDKHESIIVTRDKIPYEIPDSWVWCKLSDLAILENGDRSSKYPVEADYVEIGIPFFGAKDIDGDMMSFQNVRFISQQKYDELGNGKLVDGDIICLLRGSVGKTAKFEANEQFDTGFICAQMLIIRLLDKSLFGYISSYFKSPDYTNYVESKVTGTAVRQMPAKEMGNLLIPLPPLAEQHRIVAKIEEIMPMIERLTLR